MHFLWPCIKKYGLCVLPYHGLVYVTGALSQKKSAAPMFLKFEANSVLSEIEVHY